MRISMYITITIQENWLYTLDVARLSKVSLATKRIRPKVGIMAPSSCLNLSIKRGRTRTGRSPRANGEYNQK